MVAPVKDLGVLAEPQRRAQGFEAQPELGVLAPLQGPVKSPDGEVVGPPERDVAGAQVVSMEEDLPLAIPGRPTLEPGGVVALEQGHLLDLGIPA